MKLSIITPTLNQSKFIEDTIVSVLNQNYNNFEHIIIDGGSNDGTIDILKRYPHLKWISEKDSGQSNAINKGFHMASGDIVAWINSDDFYEKDIFALINNYFENNNECHFLYGDITFIDKNKKFMFKTDAGNLSYKELLSNPDIVRQPSCFWKSTVFNEIGFLNERLHLIMDYDFFLRIAHKHALHYLNKNFSYFRYYEDGKSLKYSSRQFFELVKLMIKTPAVFNARSYKFLFKKFYRAFFLKK